MTDPVRAEEMRRDELQARQDALELMDMPGWKALEAEALGLLKETRDFLERGLPVEDYHAACGQIRGLRTVLEMPRKAVALGDTIIKERDE